MKRILTMDEKNYTDAMPEKKYYTVRAIIIKDGRFSMQLSKNGEYKIPGGGIENNENHVDALVREVREETGHNVIRESVCEIGETLEMRRDVFDGETKFVRYTYFYFCRVMEKEEEMCMTQSEIAKGFRPVYADAATILAANDKVCEKYSVCRDTEVIRMIAEGKLEAVQDILMMKPFFTHNVWGGTRLSTDFGYDVSDNDIGECWGIAAHPNGCSTVCNGYFKGKNLNEVYMECRGLFGCYFSPVFPLLVKIIDSNDDLSIQVHPDDEYANEHENGSLGKTECWYVLDCKEGSEIVAGHNAATPKEVKNMIEEGRWDDFIRKIPVKKGDFIQIDPGTVHAITAGCLMLETQQNSDITYRLYDYDRLWNGEKRELHIQKSIDVIKTPASDTEKMISHTLHNACNSKETLSECNYYSVFHINSVDYMNFEKNFPFINMTVINGEGTVNGLSVKKGDHFILTSMVKSVHIHGTMEIIASGVHPDYRIRFAAIEDKAEIMGLYKAAIGTKGCTWDEEYPNEDTFENRDLIGNDLICMENYKGEIISALSIDKDPVVAALKNWNVELEPSRELSRMVVRRDYQNKGIARIMIRHAMSILKGRGYKSAHFLVSEKNERAMASYARLLYEQAGSAVVYDKKWICYEKKV